LPRAKIFNDPVYGFVAVPDERLFRIVEHPWFQRLRRIQQLGLGSLVYPGAIHTRFQHALGAMHLMQKALDVLRSKGYAIAEGEANAACAAILLHDIGHGPFSHALEHMLAPGLHHEELSLAFLKALPDELGADTADLLAEAEAIFTGRHPRPFLHELVSSQLDVDRLDYLTRDTYFTGVHEGVIGWNRILDMLELEDDRLVVESKAIYSLEKFIVARRIMYWQVYLHKTVLCAEELLIRALSRARALRAAGEALFAAPALAWILDLPQQASTEHKAPDAAFLTHFAQLDDSDIWSALKVWARHGDPVLALLSRAIVERRLFRLHWLNKPLKAEPMDALQQTAIERFGLSRKEDAQVLVFQSSTANAAYDPETQGITIRFRDGRLQDLAKASDQLNIRVLSDPVLKHYICLPKELTVTLDVYLADL
jgi:HD superfamily phosphohydrolase